MTQQRKTHMRKKQHAHKTDNAAHNRTIHNNTQPTPLHGSTEKKQKHRPTTPHHTTQKEHIIYNKPRAKTPAHQGIQVLQLSDYWVNNGDIPMLIEKMGTRQTTRSMHHKPVGAPARGVKQTSKYN
jgi:hypothetical protein